MKKITCVGYHDTGSSVVDDLFREFPCFAQGGVDKECRFLQDPDGVSDLEFNLVENPHRLNSGFALKRFRIMAKENHRVYERIFGKRWMQHVEDYIDDLIKLKYKGYWHGDIWLLNPIVKNFYWFIRAINKVLPKAIAKPYWYNYFPKLETYHCCITEDEFLTKTRNFMETLCSELEKDGVEYILLDQLIHPNNISRYLRYVYNLKVVIVDRDPRDIYIEEMRYKEHILPTDPHVFCEVYKDSRRNTHEYENSEAVLRINFEDMIYNYEKSVQKICDFVGIEISQHKYPKRHFNPLVSVKNTKLWEKYPEYREATVVIEKELSDFLYQYE